MVCQCLHMLLIYASFLILFLLLALYIILKITTTSYPNIIRYEEEKYFLNVKSQKKEKFPTIDEEPSLDLSVIIPAYEEEKRLPIMLDECLDFLEDKAKNDKKFSYEVIIVSDGSKDKTVQVASEYAENFDSNRIRILDLVRNRGKGGAVRLGMQSGRGKFLLFADADGATKFPDYEKLEASISKLCDNDYRNDAIAIGSRAHLEEEATATRSIFRTILMHGFHFLVWFFAVRKLRDTQCGFKLMTRSTVQKIFPIMHVERWAFDVELLFIAQSYKIPIDEISVRWTEIDGSKITPFWSWLQMGRDLILIWFRYATGIWKLNREHFKKQ
uniref:Dolichyl-phosphate beta-glucosyltransferase n=1 Tax=Corethrella appendiculata TaxID=1370023 RepID=U5EVJ0_9DIPT